MDPTVAQNLKANVMAKLGVLAAAEADVRTAMADAVSQGLKIEHGLGDEVDTAARSTAKFFVELV